MCPRALILDRGRIVADGPTADLLADRELLAEHGLYLPWGFDPALGTAAQLRARQQRAEGA